MVGKKSLARYVSHQSSVFVLFLTRLKHLLECNIARCSGWWLTARSRRAPIVRVLINLYTGKYVRVQWWGILSDYFLAVNGVKRVGVLSPVLFILYIDGLLMALSHAGRSWMPHRRQFCWSSSVHGWHSSQCPVGICIIHSAYHLRQFNNDNSITLNNS